MRKRQGYFYGEELRISIEGNIGESEMTNIDKKQVDLIRESICVYTKCAECRTLFKEGQLSFTKIEEFVDDKGKSCLFRLKEMSHELFRNSNEASYKEKLYDITVGYIFHESMKLRENLYQLEFYRPSYDKVPDTLTDLEKKIVHEIEVLTKKARKKLEEGIKEVKVLIIELVAQLKGLIKLYEDNYLLPRFIFENEKSFVSIYGRKGFGNLLNDLFGGGKDILMFKAALSYLESEYYDIARLIFRKISANDRKNKTALFLWYYSSAFHFYFKNRFSRSLVFAECANAVDAGTDKINIHRDALKKLIIDLSKEMRKAKKV